MEKENMEDTLPLAICRKSLSLSLSLSRRLVRLATRTVRRGSGTSVIVATVSREPVKSECILNIIHRLYRYIHYQFSDYTSEKINYYTLVISVWVVKYRVYVVSFLFFLIFFFPFLCFSPPNTCGVSCAWMLVCDAVGLRARVCVCVYTLHMSRVSSVYRVCMRGDIGV